MAVIELDFHQKSNNKNPKTTNQKKATQTTHSPFEPMLLRQFRKLNELDQGRILGRIDTMLRDYE